VCLKRLKNFNFIYTFIYFGENCFKKQHKNKKTKMKIINLTFILTLFYLLMITNILVESCDKPNIKSDGKPIKTKLKNDLRGFRQSVWRQIRKRDKYF